jgi:hypothetical protein
MVATNPTTTIQVHESTRRFLDALKASGQTYEDLILEMAEDHYPAGLLRELAARFKTLHGRTAEEIFRRAGL